MTTAPDNIVDRIRKLLSLAENAGATPNEAATAMAKAQALLLRHNLDMASVKVPGAPEAPRGVGQVDIREQKGFTWRLALLSVIARNSLCRVIGTPSEKTAHLFGTRDNVRAVLAMYGWVSEQLERMALRERTAYVKQGGGANGRSWMASFYMGATGTIGDRLRKPMETFTYGTGRDLVVASDRTLAAAIHKIFPRLTSGRRARPGSSAGYQSGQQAGANISFGRPAQLGGGRLALPSGR